MLTHIQKRKMGHISETEGAMQILSAFLVLACRNTPSTQFLCNLKKKSYLREKNAKGFFMIFYDFGQKISPLQIA